MEGTTTRPPIPSTWTTAMVPTWGHLSWIGWFWVGAGIVLAGALVLGSRYGRFDDSFWQGVTTVLAWVTFAAGVTTVPVYGPIFIANGMTRQRLARSAVVAAVAVCVVGGLAAALGYAIEHVVFDANGWTHRIEDGVTVTGFASIAPIAVSYVASLACFYASGWLVGIAYLRLGWVAFILALVPAAVPIVASEALLRSTTVLGSSPIELPLAVGIAGAFAVAAVGGVVATRLGRDVTFQP